MIDRVEDVVDDAPVHIVSQTWIREFLVDVVDDRFDFLFDEVVEALKNELRFLVGIEGYTAAGTRLLSRVHTSFSLAHKSSLGRLLTRVETRVRDEFTIMSSFSQ